MTNTSTEPRWDKESYECSEMKTSVIHNDDKHNVYLFKKSKSKSIKNKKYCYYFSVRWIDNKVINESE